MSFFKKNNINIYVIWGLIIAICIWILISLHEYRSIELIIVLLIFLLFNIIVVFRDITEQKKYLEKIEQAHIELDQIFNTASDGMRVLDNNNVIIRANETFCSLVRVDVKDIIGKSCHEIFRGNQCRTEKCSSCRILKGENHVEFDDERIRLDGTVVPCIVTARPFYDTDANIIGIVESFKDITERKKTEEELQKSEERYRKLVSKSPDIILLYKNGKYTFVNEKATEVLGYTNEELLNMNMLDILDERYKSKVIEVMYKRTLGEAVDDYEIEIVTKSGNRRSVIVRGASISYGKDAEVLVVLVDITEHKRVEQELNRAKEAAEAANRAKSEFLANMSHEIRTPMNGIIGMTELVMSTELTDEQREYVNMVRSSAGLLLRVINDILDFSKIEAGKLELEEESFNLRDEVGIAIDMLAIMAHSKELELNYSIQADIPENVIGDCVRLRQVLVNLVGNAIKFTSWGEVNIWINNNVGESLNPDECNIHFAVEDTGIGISIDKTDKLFKSFSQIDGSTTRKYGGTGLGLIISKQLVEMMGGTIGVESDTEKGSKFYFTIPLKKQNVSQTKKKYAITNMKDLKILIVDDNETNRRILNEILVNWGISVKLASNGEEAIDFLDEAFENNEPYNLVFIDANMPKINGFEVVEKIKNTRKFESILIMMINSNNVVSDAAKCRELGIVQYLIKPIRQSQLFDAIMSFLNDGQEEMLQNKTSIEEEVHDEFDKYSGNINILLVEDSVVNQKLAIAMLKKKDWNITTVTDGKKALKTLENGFFDIILMDVQMPEMDGFETTAAIRKMEKQTGNHMPIIAMTANAMKGDREECLASGMDEYVSKPINADDLYSKIIHQVTKKIKLDNSKHEIEIDFSNVMSIFGEDKELLVELLGNFMVDYPKQLNEIKKAIEAKETNMLYKSAHKFKGSVANFGFNEAVELARELEEMGKKLRVGEASEVLEKLILEMEKFKLFFSNSNWINNIKHL